MKGLTINMKSLKTMFILLFLGPSIIYASSKKDKQHIIISHVSYQKRDFEEGKIISRIFRKAISFQEITERDIQEIRKTSSPLYSDYRDFFHGSLRGLNKKSLLKKSFFPENQITKMCSEESVISNVEIAFLKEKICIKKKIDDFIKNEQKITGIMNFINENNWEFNDPLLKYISLKAEELDQFSFLFESLQDFSNSSTFKNKNPSTIYNIRNFIVSSLLDSKNMEDNIDDIVDKIDIIRSEMKKEDMDKILVIKLSTDLKSLLKSKKPSSMSNQLFYSLSIFCRILISKQFDQIASDILEVALEQLKNIDLSQYKEEYQDIVQIYLLTFIKKEDFQTAFKKLYSLHILDKFDLLGASGKFFLTLILEKNKHKQTIDFYKNIIKYHPVSFYAILSHKRLFLISGRPKKTFSAHLSDLKNSQSITPNDLSEQFSKIKIHENTLPLLKKIFVWYRINDKILYAHALQNYLKQINSTSFILTSTLQKQLQLSLPHLSIILLAKSFQLQKEFLKSFAIIQEFLESDPESIHLAHLVILFPYRMISPTVLSELKKGRSSLVLALMRQESGFNPQAKSIAGAMGLMQLMPGTARLIKRNVRRKDLYHPVTNVRIGQKYLNRLLDKYNFNLIHTFAAYNAGEGNVERWIKNQFITFDPKFNYIIENIPFSETRNYVKLLLRNLFFYKLLYSNEKDSEDENTVFETKILGYL
jgi:hypothetical protein